MASIRLTNDRKKDLVNIIIDEKFPREFYQDLEKKCLALVIESNLYQKLKDKYIEIENILGDDLQNYRIAYSDHVDIEYKNGDVNKYGNIEAYRFRLTTPNKYLLSNEIYSYIVIRKGNYNMNDLNFKKAHEIVNNHYYEKKQMKDKIFKTISPYTTVKKLLKDIPELTKYFSHLVEHKQEILPIDQKGIEFLKILVKGD
jgi:hypothetical protein